MIDRFTRLAFVLAACTLTGFAEQTPRARGQSTSSRTPATAAALAGEYSNSHPITMYDAGQSHVVQVSDSLTLSASPSGDLTFTLEIAATNGHTCSVEGVATKVPAAFEYRERIDVHNGEPPVDCVLRFTPSGKTVVVEDVERHCRVQYCGARAVIGRIVFRR